MNEITHWCVTERENMGLSQELLARWAKISIAQLRQLEGGGAPTLDVLRALTNVLPVTEDQARRWCARDDMARVKTQIKPK
jgi:transcriptional regulator with XRE-family HTH domain